MRRSEGAIFRLANMWIVHYDAAMSGIVRPTMTSSMIFVISTIGITKITLPAGPEGRD